MNRSLLVAGAAALALASPPAPAVGPLVLIAKQIVQGMVKDFIEQRIDQAIRASFGPCKADLAEAAVATRRSLTGAIGGGGVPGLGALGAWVAPAPRGWRCAPACRCRAPGSRIPARPGPLCRPR